MTIRSMHLGTSCAACLAIALAAVGSAFAENEQDPKSKQSSSQQSDSQYGSKSDQQDQQTRQQSKQRDQQTRQGQRQTSQSDQQANQSAEQRQQQARQREQQAQQRQREQARQREQTQRLESQGRQIEQQAGQRSSQQQRDQSSTRQRGDEEWSSMPQPDREQFGRDQQRGERQFGRSEQYGRSQQQMGRDSQQEAGLGVSIQDSGREGVVVQRVHRGSPAEEMGIETGDIITSVDGQEVRSSQEFIRQIRDMNPGDEVEIEIRRDRDQLTVSGELESRDQALVLRGGERQRDIWQSGYEEERGSAAFSQGRSSRDDSGRLQQIERQVNRLSQEIDQLRYTLRDLRGQSGERGWSRETTAGYDEFQQGTSPRRTAERWEGESNRYRQADRNQGVGRSFDSGQRGQQSGQFDRDQSGARSRQYDSDQGARQSREPNRDISGPGGEIGTERQRVGTEDIRE